MSPGKWLCCFQAGDSEALPRTVMPKGGQGVLGGLHHGWVLRSAPDVVVGTSPKITKLSVLCSVSLAEVSPSSSGGHEELW